jgi:DNA helicase-2/ATP-dependent DNA helicase PcrA
MCIHRRVSDQGSGTGGVVMGGPVDSDSFAASSQSPAESHSVALSESAARRALRDILGFQPSEPQFDALSADLVPGVVVAGAGSGKTAVMSARMVWLVLTGQVTPGHLLGLTFTNKAAHELLGRTREYLAKARGLDELAGAELLDADPVIATYHSFASGIISEHGLRIGVEPQARLLTDGAREQLAARVIATTDRDMSAVTDNPQNLVAKLLKLDDAMSELGLTPDQIRDDASRLIESLIAIEHNSKLIEVGRQMLSTARYRMTLTDLVEDFRAAKHARNMLDFADQVRLARQIVDEFPEVAEHVRAAHRVVLLDEYQDTSIAQRLLLQEIFGNGHPVTAVGDPCQAIYEWRGASVVNIERFAQHFPVIEGGVSRAADTFPLLDNRRSGPAILELANTLSVSLRADRPGLAPLVAAPRDDLHPGHVRVALVHTVADEIDFVADQIAHFPDIQENQGTPAWGDVLVLARNAEHLRDLDRALRERKVPTQLIGTASLLDQPVVSEVRSYLEVIAEPTANAALVRILTGPRWRIGPRDLAFLGAAADERVRGPHREGRLAVADALIATVSDSDVDDQPSLLEIVLAITEGELHLEGLSADADARVIACGRILRELRAHAQEPPVDLIGRVLQLTGLGAQAMVGDPLHVAERGRALQEFINLAARFDDINGTRASVNLIAFLTRLADAEAYDASPTFEAISDSGAVRLMTVHKAKGLEAPHVFVTGLTRGKFPSSQTRDRWNMHPHVVPWRLRDDAPAPLASWPDLVSGPRMKDHDAFRADSHALEAEEERRLMYVAVTRAKRTVTLTGYGWGAAAKEYSGPGEFLEQARQFVLDSGGEVLVWTDPPAEGETNPLMRHSRWGWSWPPESPEAHRDAAEQVGAVMAAMTEPDTASLSADVMVLIAEERRRRQRLEPRLPDRVSVSDLVRWQADPAGMAQRLARPMPQPPSSAAYRGAVLHAWIEQHFRSRRLLTLDDIPGAVDDGIDTDEWLAPLKRAFVDSEWAGRTPIAIEEAFVVMHEGREVRGRIDAVFHVAGRDVVVDWKTGTPGGADPAQLDLYRIAWAAITDQPIDAIDAQFVYL